MTSRLTPEACGSGDAQLVDREVHVPHGRPQWTELHRRDVIRWNGDYFAVCSCGFVSTCRPTRYLALIAECEVEAILAVCAERRRRLYER